MNKTKSDANPSFYRAWCEYITDMCYSRYDPSGHLCCHGGVGLVPEQQAHNRLVTILGGQSQARGSVLPAT